MYKKDFDMERFKHIAGDCTVEDFNYLPRSREGMQKWEIKARTRDGSCKIVVLRDTGFNISGGIIKVNDFTNREERNIELRRLYFEEGLSQLFLANLFNISQPAVSIIVNSKK